MARKTISTERRKTVSKRDQSRRDKSNTKRVNADAIVASIYRKAGFEVKYPRPDRPNVMDVETQTEFITTVVWPVVNEERVNDSLMNTIKRFANKRSQMWIVGLEVTKGLRTRYPDSVSILNVAEFDHEVEGLRASILARAPVKRTTSNLRTRVAKAIVTNGPQLKTAITTSIILIEERLEVINSTRPNAEESKAKKADEIDRLTIIRGQLETLRDYPELLKAGKVTERAAGNVVKSLSQGIGEYWTKHTDAICDKMLTFGLFSSLVLVGQIVGVTPEFSFGLAGSMTYGKPVVDALRAMKGWFKADK